MESKTVNLIVRYSTNDEFHVEVSRNPVNYRIQKDSKTNENLHINCSKCQESIQLSVFFYNSEKNGPETEFTEVSSASTSFVKCEPDIVSIKKEESEDETEDIDMVNEDAYSEDESEGQEEPDATSTMSTDENQTLYTRKFGKQDDIITNFDLSKEICDICGHQKHRNNSITDFLKHRAQHFMHKKGLNDYHCIACKKSFDNIDRFRFHTRTCVGVQHLVDQHKSGNINFVLRTVYKPPKDLPEGVVLPDITKFEVPFYKCIDQPNGSKVWIEKSKSIKGLRISNFDTRILKCDLCATEVKYKSMYIRHRKLHLFQQEGDQKCLGCYKIFPKPDDRVAHAYFCPKKDTVNVLACSYCDFIAGTYLLLRNHIGATHGKNKDSYGGHGKVICHICSKEVRRSKLYGHLLRHEVADGRPYTCAHCEKRFAGRGALKNHLVKFHFKAMATYSCHLCPLCFKGRQEYEKHMFSRHKIGKSAAVTCHLCQKVLASDSSLNVHMKSQHIDASEKQKFGCPHCEKFFFKKRNLEAHIPTHLPESERPFKCWCGRGYATRDKLNRHNLEHTDPSKLLSVCTVCGKSMKSKQSLKVHMRIHTGKCSDEI